jgi:hypothetical protein
MDDNNFLRTSYLKAPNSRRRLGKAEAYMEYVEAL